MKKHLIFSFVCALVTITLFQHALTAGYIIIHDVEITNDGISQVETYKEISKNEDIIDRIDSMVFSPSFSSEDGIHYICRNGIDVIAYFGVSEVQYNIGGELLKLDFPGSMQVIPFGEEPMDSITNYFFGNNPAKWRTGLSDCSILRYPNIYPGIDLVYRISNGNLKYEFVIFPDAQPEIIKMRYPNADNIDVNNNNIIISKLGFSFADTGLFAFQENIGIDEVDCKFQSTDKSTVGFHVGYYEKSQELIIDPLLIYSTFLGGSDDDSGYDIAVENGYTYVTGNTLSSNFPTANAMNSTHIGAADCFLAKFSFDCQSLVYCTYFGGSLPETGFAIAVENGYVYITGHTSSSDFPTINAFNSTHSGITDVFVTKFDLDGQSLIYSTYLGGSQAETPNDIAVENSYAYITGMTMSSDFATSNAYDSSYNGGSYDCFVTKFRPNGQSLAFSTYLGGSALDEGFGIAVENSYVYVTGFTTSGNFPIADEYDSSLAVQDCFLTKFEPNGQSLVYSTYLGGSSSDSGMSVTVEGSYAYITGFSTSGDFPTTINSYDSSQNGGADCFVTKFEADGQALNYSTFIGGSLDDAGYDITVKNEYAYIVGTTLSSDYPTINAYDCTYNGLYDVIVTKLAESGQCLVYSTYLGGTGHDESHGIAVDNWKAFIVGFSDADFPVTMNAYNSTFGGGNDCFLSILFEDSDNDGLPDPEELIHGTDPYCIDTDNDNFLDGYEVQYGSNATDPLSYPAIPQAWFDALYTSFEGNATLIQNLITWSEGNYTMLQNVMLQMEIEAGLVQQIIMWLDGNHTAIETLFTYLEGNATLLMQAIDALNGNATQLDLVAALVSQNTDYLQQLNSSSINNITEIRAVLNQLGVSAGDSDYDGLDDLDEISLGTDILCIDTDCDNLNDAFEVKIGTDPLDDDTDSDTYLDGVEVLAGTDPLDSTDYPGATTTSTPTTTTITTTTFDFTTLLIPISIGGVIIIMIILLIKRRKA